MTEQRTQPRPEPNDLERALAGHLAPAKYVDGIARHLAGAREGDTLEGPRATVSGDAQIPRFVYEGPDGERALEEATRYAWRSWFVELHRQGLRPCGWPAARTTHLVFAPLANGSGPWAEVEPGDERTDLVLVSVTCEAVPA